MSLKQLADDAVARVESSIPAALSDAERDAVARIVEQAIIDAVNDVTKRCAAATSRHVGHDADKAHKIAEELKLQQTALISNLEGLR